MATIISLKDKIAEDAIINNIATPENTTPDTVLNHALSKLNTVIIIGTEINSNNLYIASSSDDGSELNLLIDLAKNKLLKLLTEGCLCNEQE